MSDAYFNEVMADSPLGYWRLDRTGAATTGDEITDISGNDLHGELVYCPGTDLFQPYGYATAIETDPLSRAAHFRTVQLGSTGFPSGFCKTYAEVPHDSSLNLNDLALEVWFRLPNFRYFPTTLNAGVAIFSKPGAYGLLVRVEQLPAAGAAFLEPVFFVFTADGAYHEVQAVGYRLRPGADYHLIGRRVSTSLSIDIQGRLVNSVTMPGTATRTNTSPLIIGSAQTFLGASILDEPAVYSSLSTARGLVHYEAAKNALPVSWTALTQFPFEIDTGAPVPLEFPFLHNFAQPIGGQHVPIREFVSYSTGVGKADADYEQRNSKQPYHQGRVFEVAVTPYGVRGKQAFDAALWTPGSFYVKPVEIGLTRLTAQATAGAITLECDTTLREFMEGGWLCAAPDPNDPATYQFFRASAVTDADITTYEQVASTLPVGTPIFPCRLCRLDPDPNLDVLTADRLHSRLTFEVLSTEQPTRHITPYTPAVVYKGLEVYDRTPVRIGFLGDGGQIESLARVGRTGLVGGNDWQRGTDTGTARTVSVRFTLEGRTELAAFRGWLEARKGKLTPLWLPSDEVDLTYVSRPSTSTLVVAGHTYSETYALHHGRRDIRVTYTDGSVTYQRITAAADNGAGNDLLNVSPNMTAGKTVRELSFITQCVLLADTVEMTHHRNGEDFITEARVSLRQLLTSPA